jgi:hypothetical protein
MLRHPQGSADRLHVGDFRFGDAYAFDSAALGMRRRLLQALDQFPSEFAHRHRSISVSALENVGQLAHGSLLIGRQILARPLGLDHQQIQQSICIMVKVDHACSTALACSGPRPSDLSHAARLRDHVPGLRVGRDEVDESFALIFVPNRVGLAYEKRGA